MKYYSRIACILLCCIPMFVISSENRPFVLGLQRQEVKPENKELFILLTQGEIGLLKLAETATIKYKKNVAMHKLAKKSWQQEKAKLKKDYEALEVRLKEVNERKNAISSLMYLEASKIQEKELAVKLAYLSFEEEKKPLDGKISSLQQSLSYLKGAFFVCAVSFFGYFIYVQRTY